MADSSPRLLDSSNPARWRSATSRSHPGKKSTYYINSKKALFNGEAIACWAICSTSDEGPRLSRRSAGWRSARSDGGRRPALRQAGQTLEGFFVRKQAKGHGSQERIEGRVSAGDRVAMVDDVLTTGDSVVQAIEEVEASAPGRRVVCIVDRAPGARDGWRRTISGRFFTIRDLGIAQRDSDSNRAAGRLFRHQTTLAGHADRKSRCSGADR